MNAKLHSTTQIHGIDKPVSALALGTASFRSTDKERWFALLDRFWRAGGTVLDSGRSYGDSEAVIGEWLETRHARDDVLLVTKCAHGDAILPAEDFEGVVTRELSESLDNLRTDHIDIYMLHRDNPVVPVGRIVERLNREVERGRVRALGASNWTYARVDSANEYATQHSLQGFAVVSNNLSLATPTGPFYPGLVSTDPAGEQWHEATGTLLLSWSAQARGFFTGQYAAAVREQTGDTFASRMAEVYATPDNLERLRRAQVLGQRLGGYSAVQIALTWLLHKPFPLVPVVGPRTPAELTSCVDAISVPLTGAECAWLNLEPGP
jgi:aryl-alcohol dehydrogenase-like predicted oxidoreductase